MTPEYQMIIQLIEAHNRAIREELKDLREASENRHVEVMELITTAFPEGDLKSHYRYHMGLIEEAASRKTIKLEVWKKIVAGSVWSMLAYAFLKFIEWAKDHVR